MGRTHLQKFTVLAIIVLEWLAIKRQADTKSGNFECLRYSQTGSDVTQKITYHNSQGLELYPIFFHFCPSLKTNGDISENVSWTFDLTVTLTLSSRSQNIDISIAHNKMHFCAKFQASITISYGVAR